MEWTPNYVSLTEALLFLWKLRIKIANTEYQLYSMYSRRSPLNSVPLITENDLEQNQNDELLAEQLLISIQTEINDFIESYSCIVIKF